MPDYFIKSLVPAAYLDKKVSTMVTVLSCHAVTNQSLPRKNGGASCVGTRLLSVCGLKLLTL